MFLPCVDIGGFFLALSRALGKYFSPLSVKWLKASKRSLQRRALFRIFVSTIFKPRTMNIDQLSAQAIDLLKQMIKTPSLSREEDKVASLVAQFLEDKGYKLQRERNNLILQTAYRADKPTVLLNSHIDTVKAAASWTKDPFGAEEDGDKLYGLGSNDAGASVVSLLSAFIKLSEKEQAYNLIFLASAEEEVSGKNGVEYALTCLPKIDFAIVGEPTEMLPAIAEKGLMVVDGICHGISGHAAREEGVNAIYKAMQDVQWVQDFQFPKVSDLLGPVKVSITQIEAGTSHNVVPDQCHYVMDIRSNELYSNEEIFSILQEHTLAELKARSFRLNSSFIAPDHPFMLRCQAKGLTPYGSPTLSDQCLMPFSSIKMGPGHSSRSHSADEFIKKSEIKAAIAQYVELLDGLEL